MPATPRFKPVPGTIDNAMFKVAIMVSVALHLLLLLALAGVLPDGTPPSQLPVTTLRVSLLATAPTAPPKRADQLAQHDNQGGETTDLPPQPTQPDMTAPTQGTGNLAAAHTIVPPSPPRPQATLGPAAVGVSWAGYVESWRQRVEKIGNLNYPVIARQRGLFGSLELLVTIRDNGELMDVRILRSSGQPVLDQAALNIVRLAAPYPPFPPTLAAEYGSLQVVRKWTFTSSHQLAGS